MSGDYEENTTTCQNCFSEYGDELTCDICDKAFCPACHASDDEIFTCEFGGCGNHVCAKCARIVEGNKFCCRDDARKQYETWRDVEIIKLIETNKKFNTGVQIIAESLEGLYTTLAMIDEMSECKGD